MESPARKKRTVASCAKSCLDGNGHREAEGDDSFSGFFHRPHGIKLLTRCERSTHGRTEAQSFPEKKSKGREKREKEPCNSISLILTLLKEDSGHRPKSVARKAQIEPSKCPDKKNYTLLSKCSCSRLSKVFDRLALLLSDKLEL